MSRFRLLPTLIGFLSLFLAIKMYDVATGVGHLQDVMANPAQAEEKKEEEEKKPADEEKAKDEKPAEEEGTEKKEDGGHGDAKKSEHGEKSDKLDDMLENKDVTKDPQKAKKGMVKEFSQVEIDLLQNLSQRRAELEKWSEEIKLKENMLKATEERVNSKITDMKALKAELDNLLIGYDKEEDAKIKSLVKIYENMKPKDAARIFEQLDMPVLLLVADRMSERKIAPVLAAMTPERAKELTIELAEARKVKEKIDGRAGDQPLP